LNQQLIIYISMENGMTVII